MNPQRIDISGSGLAAPAAYGATLLRIALGAMWISHGLLKVLVFTLPGAAKFFDSVGLPGVLVYPVVLAELAGGLAILFGWHGRWVSLLLSPVLLVATWVHSPNGWVFTAANGGWEYPAFLLVASITHVLLGDGRWAASSWRTTAHVPLARRASA
jgi:putative oxidoreductase